MAVVRDGRGRGRGRLPEGEAPDSHVAEESKKVIKDLVARQTQAGTSLDQQRAREREREFHRAAAVLPLSSVSAGASSLGDFTASAERARRAEDLAGSGLPLHDLQLLLDHEDGVDEASRLSLPERLARADRLRDIRQRLSSSTTSSTTTGQQPGPSRHVQELDASLRLAGRHDPAARLALLTASKDAADEDEDEDEDAPAGGADGESRFRDVAPQPEDHPALRLGALERRMFAHLDVLGETTSAPSATSRKRRRLRQAVDQPKGAVGQPSTECLTSSAAGRLGGGAGAGRSLWDVREVREAAAAPCSRSSRRVQSAQASARERPPCGPARAKQYTIRDGKIVELGAATDPGDVSQGTKDTKGTLFVPTGHGVLSVEDLRKNRLSVEEIRQLPRFASYEEGAPSTVLYVKNLDGGVTEDDLAAVFGSFREGAGPSLRLCTGRMRGQAFVTFPTQDAARAALDATNGFLMRGRPMVVQFGRSHGSTS